MPSPSGACATWGRCFGAASSTLSGLFDEDMLGDDLEAWLDESYLLKRTFRACHHRRADREAPSRQGEIRPPDDRLRRPTYIYDDIARRRSHESGPHPAAGDTLEIGRGQPAP
jgi:hypothetical protein